MTLDFSMNIRTKNNNNPVNELLLGVAPSNYLHLYQSVSLGNKFQGMLNKEQKFDVKEIYLKMSSAK